MSCIDAGRMLVGAVFGLMLAWMAGGPSVAHAQAIPRMNGERAMTYLRAQTDFGPRVPGTDAHRKTRDYIAQTLREYARTVELQSFTHRSGGREIEMTNIVASFGKRDAAPILLSAHWDTRPFADQEKDPDRARRPILGANDGASGVAVLLEIARHLDAAPPVTIVLFDGEDYGRTMDEMFLGSRYYARHPIPRKPRYGILLDMIGDADLTIPIEPNSRRAAPQLVRDIWRIAEEMGISNFSPKMGPAVYDDHISLIEQGIPAIDLIDFDYPYWHTLDDTPDKCSAESLRRVGDVLLRFLYTRDES